MSSTAPDPGLRRRTVLKALAAAGVVGASGLTWQALTRSPARFDLAGPSSPLYDLQGTLLHEEHRIMQSFAFDNANRRLFIAQIQDDSDGNDLCINHVGFDGQLLGSMHLPDAGHGVSFGVEPVGDVTYLWTEARSDEPAYEGRGTALQRFAFRDGREPQDAQVHLTGSKNITCATDPDSERLLVRREVDDEFTYTVHELGAAREGDFSEPVWPAVRPAVDGTFQGYGFAGRHLYVLTGSRQDDPDEIDSALSAFDLSTGEVLQDQVPVRAGRDLPFREPEGVAVQRTDGGALRLCFGMASREEPQRLANLYYLDATAG